MKKFIFAFIILFPTNLLANSLQNYVFSSHGVDNIKIGMTIKEAGKASKQKFKNEDWGPEITRCGTAVSDSGLSVLLHDNKIESIAAASYPDEKGNYERRLQTIENIKLGDSVARVKQVYPNAKFIEADAGGTVGLVVEKTDGTGYVFELKMDKDSEKLDTMEELEAKGEGNVFGIKVGLISAILLREGCV